MAGSVDTWTTVATNDGASLQGKRNTTLGTGTMSFRLIRTTSRGKTRVLWEKTGISDANFETWLAVFEV